MKNCGQVNVPTVDNSELACENPVLDTCVLSTEDISFLGTEEGALLATVRNAIVEKLVEQQRLINIANTAITQLQQGTTLDTTIYSLSFVGTDLNLLADSNIISTVDLSSLVGGGIGGSTYTLQNSGNTLELVEDGTVVSIIDLTPYLEDNNLLEFDTEEAATLALGIGQRFRFSQTNLDGVPSPNGATTGVTQP